MFNKPSAILAARLANQQITASSSGTAGEIVQYLGAMQAQDFAMAKWAIGLRVPGLVDADVEAAFNKGEILRTHVLRPTWHFVSPTDVKWMLQLTAPRIKALSAYYHRASGLDGRVFKKSARVIVKALSGSNYLTRTALQQVLTQANIKTEGLQLTYIMMQAELDAVICSGPREGKQFTYALLDERAPGAKNLHRQEALAALALRYFTTRGPATLNDYATWSGLAVKDAKESISLIEEKLHRETIDGKEYYFDERIRAAANRPLSKLQATFLMPDYDEYAISYKDRTELFGERKSNANAKTGNPVFYHTLILNGVAAGTWQKITTRKQVDVSLTITGKLNKTQQQAVAKAVKRYLRFVNGEKQ